MSNYVVIARFDNETNNKIVNVQGKLSTAGYSMVTETSSTSQWPPHITIAAYENFNEKLICEWTDKFSNTHKQMDIALHSLSILPPGGKHTDTAVVCLDPAHSKGFVEFYYDFHAQYEEFCTGIGYFNSITHGNLVIHSTIGIMKVHELQNVLETLFGSNIFGIARIVALEVYTYPMKLIKHFELK